MTSNGANGLARNMVCEWGMSELGPLAFGKGRGDFSWPRKLPSTATSAKPRPWTSTGSERIVSIAYESAKIFRTLIATFWSALRRAWLEREVLDANEVRLLIEGKPLPEKPRRPPTVRHRARRRGPEVVRPGIAPAPGFYAGR